MKNKYFNLKKSFIIFLVISMTQFISYGASSVEPDEIMQNKKSESRARCMICQNQSIDDSNAPLAKDLRILIRNKIKEGKNDKEIYKFLTDRYGDFILLKPPFKLSTLALWCFPFIFFIIGIFLFFSNKKKLR